jgi:hypothetical protein
MSLKFFLKYFIYIKVFRICHFFAVFNYGVPSNTPQNHVSVMPINGPVLWVICVKKYCCLYTIQAMPRFDFVSQRLWILPHFYWGKCTFCRSQWPCCLRRRSGDARLLRLWVRIPPPAWMSVCCEFFVLSGTGLCDELIARPLETYRLWCVVVCGLEI